MPNHSAHGTFDVQLKPLPPYNMDENARTGRMSIDKTFYGDMTGVSVGEMLTGMTSMKNSAGYVAIERVSGSIHGREGAFLLQHSSTMNRGVPAQHISVIPDSATGALTGLTGTMTIRIDNGSHFYDFQYELPA